MESLGPRVCLVCQESAEQQETQELRERRVTLELVGKMDQLVAKVNTVFKVPLVYLDLSDWLHPRENVETLDLEESPAVWVSLEIVEALDLKDPKVSLDNKDFKADLDLKETSVCQENEDRLVPLDPQEREEAEDQRANRVF